MKKRDTDPRTTDDDAEDLIRNTAGAFPESEIVDLYVDAANQEIQDPFQRNAIALEIGKRRAKAKLSQMQKRATQSLKKAQTDWVALESSIISIGDGMYVTFMNATVDAIAIKSRAIDENVDKQIAAQDIYHGTVDPVVDYMVANDIATFGDARRLMGLA